jgi:hypothetical protein
VGEEEGRGPCGYRCGCPEEDAEDEGRVEVAGMMEEKKKHEKGLGRWGSCFAVTYLSFWLASPKGKLATRKPSTRVETALGHPDRLPTLLVPSGTDADA